MGHEGKRRWKHAVAHLPVSVGAGRQKERHPLPAPFAQWNPRHRDAELGGQKQPEEDANTVGASATVVLSVFAPNPDTA